MLDCRYVRAQSTVLYCTVLFGMLLYPRIQLYTAHEKPSTINHYSLQYVLTLHDDYGIIYLQRMTVQYNLLRT